LREVYKNGLDLHTIQAAVMANVPEEDVTKEQRSRAKPVNFGSIYGMSARGLVLAAWNGYRVMMTEVEAEQALESFFLKFHQLKEWMQDHASVCMAQGRVIIGAGRTVEAAWEIGGLRYTKCCNLPIQGACADAMMRAVAKVHRCFQTHAINGGLVLSVHDELIAEVKKECAEKALHILESSMVEAFLETFPDAPTNNLVIGKIGQTWSDLK
jgi:DNA polymerase I